MTTPRPKPSDREITDVALGIVAGFLRDADLSEAAGKSGRIKVEVEICLDRGEIPWTTGSVHFNERRNY